MANWHEKHISTSSLGGRIADRVVGAMGSWAFILGQSAFVAVWVVLNLLSIVPFRWDIYPFIALNLVFSTQAAYASPLILMSANRAAQRDKHQADAQFEDTRATHEIAAQLQDLIKINNQLTTEIHKIVLANNS